MKRILAPLFFITTLIFGGFLHAEALTETQISAVLNLLTSFGADPVTVANVESALRDTPNQSSTNNFVFTRNLSLGDRSEDVRQLQIALNSLSCCGVASSGAGSSGRETTYFGSKTRNAVIRFQNTYRNDILVPSGLSFGNGYVGPRTRAKLNDLLQKESPATSEGPRINSVTPVSGVDGTEVTITGTGFSETSNFVLIGFATYRDVPSVNGEIKITINSGIPEDKKQYQLPLETYITVRTNGVYSNETPFTLLSSDPVVSSETKNEYRNRILNLLNLPDNF